MLELDNIGGEEATVVLCRKKINNGIHMWLTRSVVIMFHSQKYSVLLFGAATECICSGQFTTTTMTTTFELMARTSYSKLIYHPYMPVISILRQIPCKKFNLV